MNCCGRFSMATIRLPSDFKEFLRLLNSEKIECYARRTVADIDGVEVNVLSLDDLIANKRACGRAKDLDDIEHLAK